MGGEKIYLASLLMVALCTRKTVSKMSDPNAAKYLQQFGYTNNNPRLGNIMSLEDLSEGVRTFQRFAGLPQTGVLDEETIDKMEQPRCGVPDIVGTEAAARKKRYALQGSKWQKKQLSYKITSYTRDLHKRVTEKQIADAFKVWEENSGLTFRKLRLSDRADIEIKFARGAHGDGDPFDGRSKTLAHAFFPQFGGDAHFDEDEPWATEPGNGRVSLHIVAAHEIGHSLGLSHSDVKTALMAPFYNPNFKGLDTDDIRAIRQLYGAPHDKNRPSPTTRTTTRRPRWTRPTKATRTTTTDTPPVGACNGRFDAITMLSNGTTFAFKEGQFWRLNDKGMEKGYPQSMRSQWGLRGKVDAALTYGRFTDFFQGSMVRRYYNDRPISGYPKRISQVYRGIPSHIDTAYVWSGNGRIYFMKGEQYWRYNPTLRMADSGYPKPISVWKGLPKSLDAAFNWNDRTYFFKNGYYWRLDDEKVEVAQSLKMPYPRRADEWWLGCKDNSLTMSGSDILAGRGDDDDSGNGATTIKSINYVIISSLLSFFVTMIL